MSRLRNGQVLRDRYQVLSLLGQGSFATVYLTNDQKWRGNLVALKEIPTGHFSEKEYAVFNAQFLQEAAFLMRLSHPGLPRVVEFFAEKQNYYLALEWVPGHTLEHEVKERGVAVSEPEVLDWGLQLAEVLRYLHSQKPYPVLLGDLKPANVVVDYQNKLRVIDFGVARYAAPQQDREYALVSPGYSPPEQYQAGRLDERCDVYSLGATLWWCLQPTALERYRFDIPSIRNSRPELTPALDAFLQTCLQSERGRRFQGADHVIRELRGVQQAASVRQVQTSPSEILSALYRDQKKKFDF
ncbi:MAG: serine/threonine protein kinase [Candidatus Eremiobacteraeota bacterium]|nr:serine/threonine protein kinase [Candidatus Eremiobacteraeota bacterium]